MKTLTYQLRKEQGLSSKQLASKALVTNYTIQVLEGKYPKYTVEPSKIHQVANALGVSMEVLLGKKSRREEDLEFELQRVNKELGAKDGLQDSYDNECMHNAFLMEDLADLRTQTQFLRIALAIETIILTLIILL